MTAKAPESETTIATATTPAFTTSASTQLIKASVPGLRLLFEVTGKPWTHWTHWTAWLGILGLVFAATLAALFHVGLPPAMEDFEMRFEPCEYLSYDSYRMIPINFFLFSSIDCTTLCFPVNTIITCIYIYIIFIIYIIIALLTSRTDAGFFLGKSRGSRSAAEIIGPAGLSLFPPHSPSSFFSSSSPSSSSSSSSSSLHLYPLSTCSNPQAILVSRPDDSTTMAASGPSLDAALRIAREFDLPADQLQRGVDAFLSQMAEGLSKHGATLSQIPTYVTSVPNGTEKVCTFIINSLLVALTIDSLSHLLLGFILLHPLIDDAIHFSVSLLYWTLSQSNCRFNAFKVCQ